MKLQKSYLSKKSDNDLVGDVEMDYWREKVLSEFVFLGLLLGGLAMVALFFLGGETKRGMFILGGVIYTFLLFLYFYKSFSYKVRGIIILSVLYTTGAFDFYLYGFFSSGLIILFAFAVLSIILFDRRAIVLVCALVLVTLLVFVSLYFTGSLPSTFSYIKEPSLFIILIVTFCSVLFIILLASLRLLEGVKRTIVTECETREKLEKEQLNLFQAKMKAEEADRLKTAFLANMSHEIRTPLNGMLGFADILRREKVEESDRLEYLDIISSNGNILMRLINDIMDISKIEAKQLEIKEYEFDLNKILEEIEKSYSKNIVSFGCENIELRLQKTQSGPLYIITDGKRLKQVISNLLDNAFKFTKDGEIEFGYHVNKEKTGIKFYVKDTGSGISNDKQEVIFDRFRQADEYNNRKNGGAGLGLSVCQGIVELMGGKLKVRSKIDFGSVFYFEIPVKIIERVDDSFYNNDFIKTINWQDKNILLVEDVLDNARLIMGYLKNTNVNIVHVETGEEALHFFEKNKEVDLVLMDIKLPGINGLHATREILKTQPKLPIIVQTAHAYEKDRSKALQAGCVDYISKPINKAELLSAISKYISYKTNNF